MLGLITHLTMAINLPEKPNKRILIKERKIYINIEDYDCDL